MLPKLDMIEELISAKLMESKKYTDDTMQACNSSIRGKYDTLLAELEKDCFYKIE